MYYPPKWIIENRVVLCRYSGVLTETDLGGMTNTLHNELQEISTSRSVYVLGDLSHINEIDPKLFNLKLFASYTRHILQLNQVQMFLVIHNKSSRPLSFMIGMLSNILPFKFHLFQNVNEAYEYITTQEPQIVFHSQENY